MEPFVYQIGLGEDEERLDKWISGTLPDLSRSYIQKCIKEQAVLINGKPQKASYRLRVEDEIVFDVPEAVEPNIEAEDILLSILYEDEDVLVVDKPKGMVVHPAPGHYSGTLVNAVMYHCKDRLSGTNGVMRPGIVHRIDRDTTGSLLVCKNDHAHNSIAEQLKEHTITRKYRAIVHGVITLDAGTVDAAIGRGIQQHTRTLSSGRSDTSCHDTWIYSSCYQRICRGDGPVAGIFRTSSAYFISNYSQQAKYLYMCINMQQLYKYLAQFI